MHLEEDALEIRAKMLERGRGTIAGCQQMCTLLVGNRRGVATCFSTHDFIQQESTEQLCGEGKTRKIRACYLP